MLRRPYNTLFITFQLLTEVHDRREVGLSVIVNVFVYVLYLCIALGLHTYVFYNYWYIITVIVMPFGDCN